MLTRRRIPPRRRAAAGSRQRGVGLLEVLVAVLVLSIGLIGLANVQINSLRFNHSAYLRSQATVLAYDVVDRMRANRQVALSGGYNIGAGDAPPVGSTVVALDLQDWRAQLAAQLPGGTGEVALGAGNMATVRVLWDDTRGVGAPLEFAFGTQL